MKSKESAKMLVAIKQILDRAATARGKFRVGLLACAGSSLYRLPPHNAVVKAAMHRHATLVLRGPKYRPLLPLRPTVAPALAKAAPLVEVSGK